MIGDHISQPDPVMTCYHAISDKLGCIIGNLVIWDHTIKWNTHKRQYSGSSDRYILEYVPEYAPRNMILTNRYILEYAPRYVLEYVPIS